jgi:PAS domain S-box-containing protein
VTPITCSGKLLGMMVAAVGKGITINDEEIGLFREVAGDIGFALNDLEMERQKEEAENALHKIAQRLREAQALGKIGSWELELDSRHLFWSDEMYALYKRDQSLGPLTFEELVSYYLPEERQKWQDMAESIIKTGEEVHYELLTRLPDGTTFFSSNIIRPLKDPSGRIIGLFGTHQDITEQKMLIDKLNQLYEEEKRQRQELQDEAKSRGMFIDVLAHELRTPLTPIIASAGMLNEIIDLQPEGSQNRLITNIHSGAMTMARRLEELLDLARYARGTFKIQPAPADLRKLIHETIFKFKPTTDILEQQLIVDLSDDLTEGYVDSSRLEQVIVNLLSNASKFSPKKGKIFFQARIVDHGLLVEIRDEGIGISSEDQSRLFQPYHRVEQDRQKFPGIGLGLAVSKQIVEAHGGTIWIMSQPGRGSTFSFRIPLDNGRR